MIIDSVLYNGEADMLEFRMKYLWDSVDCFVVVQADHTFSGKKKNLANFEKFEWAQEKTIFSSLSCEPYSNPWLNETNLRNSIMQPCQGFSNSDIIMLSDCDEVPTHEAIDTALKHSNLWPMTFDQTIVFYNLSNVNKSPWGGTIISTLGYARNIGMQPLRKSREQNKVIRNGGFHFSYFGGAEAVREKIESFSHQELNKPEFTDMENIKHSLDNAKSLFGEENENTYKVGRDFYPSDMIKLFPERWWS